MITTNEFLNALALELKIFMREHHNDSLIAMGDIRRVSGRPSLEDIASNSYNKIAVLIYWLNDEWQKSNVGESKPLSHFGVTIIASDYNSKKRDEIALEIKDRICGFLSGEMPLSNVSRFIDIKAAGGPIKFNNDRYMNLIEIDFRATLYQGQSYACATGSKDIDVHGDTRDYLGLTEIKVVDNG